MGSEYLHARFCPFVETFEQRNGEGVFKAHHLSAVVERVARIFLSHIIIVGIEISRSLVSLINATIVVELHGVDETCHRHILVLHPCGVFVDSIFLSQ